MCIIVDNGHNASKSLGLHIDLLGLVTSSVMWQPSSTYAVFTGCLFKLFKVVYLNQPSVLHYYIFPDSAFLVAMFSEAQLIPRLHDEANTKQT